MIRTVIQAGFGNQLFQYATGYALSRELGQTLELDISFFDDYNRKERDNGRINNLDILNLDKCTTINNPNTYWQYRLKEKLSFLRYSYVNGKVVPCICEDIPNCRLDQRALFKHIGKNGAAIFGFWQNTSYFKKYLADLKRQFVPNYPLSSEVQILLDKIQTTHSVGVHIRRGDFVRLGWNKGSEYYDKGMDMLRMQIPGCHFYIVTDDVKWAKEQYANISKITILDIDTTTKDIDEFFLLSSCHHQIISESTFGWWAAFLNTNDNKYVIVPETSKGEIFEQKWLRV